MGIIEGEIKKILSSMLLSFSQINSFRKIFYSKNLEGELSQVFSDLIKNNNLDKIDEYTDKLKEKFEKKEDGIVESNITEKIINFLFKELNDEVIREKETNNKLLNDIFNGKFELSSSQSNRKEIQEIPLIFTFDLEQFKGPDYKIFGEDQKVYICLDKLIQNQIKKSILKDVPRYDNFKAINMPEICFIHNINIKDNSLRFYRTIDINEIPYEVIYFILDIDNKIAKYYKVNNIWFKLTSPDNKIEKMEKLNTHTGTPKLIIYRKRNEYIQNFLNKKEIFTKENKIILDLMNKHIIPEHEYEKYYLLNKVFLSELIAKLNDQNLSNEDKYIEAQSIIKNKNLLNVDLLNMKIDNSGNKLNLPKNFVIMRESAYVKFLEESNEDFLVSKQSFITNNSFYSYMDEIDKKIYNIKFGENLAFIKLGNNKKENILIYEYNKDKKIFDIITFMTYSKEGLFDNDVEKYISNRGGLEYFYLKKKLNFMKNNLQKINDENGNSVGILINIVDMSQHLNVYKFEQIKPPNVYLGNYFGDAFLIDNRNQYRVGEIVRANNNSYNNNNQNQQFNQNDSISSGKTSEFENPIFKIVNNLN